MPPTNVAGGGLTVFPETVIPYYPYFSFIKPAAQFGPEHLQLIEESVAVPGPTTIEIARAARAEGVVVSVGVNERDRGG
jgi:aliphatic nitrilase